MSKFDVESLLTNIKAILVANLNTKIAAVETEKVAMGAIVTHIQPIDPAAGYIEQSLSDLTNIQAQTIFYGIEHIDAVGVGPTTSQKFKCFIVVLLVDTRNDTLAKYKIHRYTRAIKEVFEDNYDQLFSSSQIRIETIAPISFKLDENTSEEMKVGGVNLYTSLA